MITRLISGLALMWIIVPHEPDLGFGRPGLSRSRITIESVHALEALTTTPLRSNVPEPPKLRAMIGKIVSNVIVRCEQSSRRIRTGEATPGARR